MSGTDHNAPALLTQSRELAVDRVFRGSLFTVVGSAGFLAGAYQLAGSLGTVASLGIVTILVVRLILAVAAPSDREEGAA